MKDKVVVITGGASGMGLAVAKALAASNTVVSLDRNASKIEALLKALPTVRSVRTDITSAEQRSAAISRIEDELGRIGVLINNAGVGGAFDFVHTDVAELERRIRNELAVNYEAPVLLTRQALGLLKKSDAPTVVVCTTGLVYAPMAKLGSYCASKAAAHFVTLAIRHQLAREGVRVVEVLPPSVDTDLNFATEGKKITPEEFAAEFLSALDRGHEVINVGQSALLEKFSRIAPSMAFRLLNKESGGR
jgi:uncharacterized oxidoreductase